MQDELRWPFMLNPKSQFYAGKDKRLSSLPQLQRNALSKLKMELDGEISRHSEVLKLKSFVNFTE